MFFYNKECIYENDKFMIIKTTIKKLYKNYGYITNWSKNRPVDPVRVEQIKLNFNSSTINNYIIDGMVSAWKKPDENILYIYDGIHRLSASLEYPEHILIMKIFTTSHESEIIDDFKKINLSVSIPFLYLEDDNELKISVCNNVMSMMCKKWRNNISPSRNPWKCNFNRDKFIDEILSKLHVDYTISNIDTVIFEKILEVNAYAKNFINTNNINVYKKCIINDFYIMYLDNAHIISKIQFK